MDRNLGAAGGCDASRRYAIPFVVVWNAALAVALAQPRGKVLDQDPREGSIRGEVRSRLLGRTDEIRIEVSLDSEGLTRVDAFSGPSTPGPDLGRGARRAGRFLRALDRRLGT